MDFKRIVWECVWTGFICLGIATQGEIIWMLQRSLLFDTAVRNLCPEKGFIHGVN